MKIPEERGIIECMLLMLTGIGFAALIVALYRLIGGSW